MKDKEKRITINREAGAMVDLLNNEIEELQKASAIEEMAKDKQWQRRDNYCLRIQKAFQYKGTADNEDVPSILADFENEIRKEILPEGSVVLSKEEWECLHNDYAKALYNARQNERKETAEKFLQLAYDKCLEKSFIKKVEELSKQFGLEIKE